MWETAKAADRIGITVACTRMWTATVGGALMAVAGAYLPQVCAGRFTKGSSARGWLAIALTFFGGWRPQFIVAEALFFAAMDVRLEAPDRALSVLGSGAVGALCWSADAREDLRQIYDRSTQAEIVDISERELVLPAPGSILERIVPLADAAPGDPQVYSRRAVYLRDLPTYQAWSLDADEYGEQACNYVIVYRYITSNERITFKRVRRCFVVLRVLHNKEALRAGITFG